MLSNSFHSSAKAHSLSSAGALAKAERHNGRGYFSFYYDQNKISDLVGTADSLAADVENAINQIFSEHIEEYNRKQRRSDRKIKTSAFEYFESNKKLDLAVESIFQIGDKESWSTLRSERSITRKGKEIILKSFSPEVKTVMDEIFLKQVSAYAHIYETHGDVIAENVRKAYDEAFVVAQKHEQLSPEFKEIYKTASKDRVSHIKTLTPDKQIAYAEYADARDTMAAIAKPRLLERIAAGQMHIEIVNATSHYDEWSPHAHAISLCYADGYENGLSSRVAKSVVLNRWALEVIQDRMHEIADQENQNHPEIFQNEDLKPKTQGRNFDYTTEQITRQNLAKLKENIAAAEIQENKARQRAKEAIEKESRALAAQDSAEAHLHELQKRYEDMLRKVDVIETLDEYALEADELENEITLQENDIEHITELESFSDRKHRKEAKDRADKLRESFGGSVNLMRRILVRLYGFEQLTDMPLPQRRAPGLHERIKAAEQKVDRRSEPTPALPEQIKTYYREKALFWNEYRQAQELATEELRQAYRSEELKGAFSRYKQAQYLVKNSAGIITFGLSVAALIMTKVDLKREQQRAEKTKELQQELRDLCQEAISLNAVQRNAYHRNQLTDELEREILEQQAAINNRLKEIRMIQSIHSPSGSSFDDDPRF